MKTNTKESHCNKAFQQWSINAFARKTVNQNNDDYILNVANAEAIPTNVESLGNDDDKPQYDQKRKFISSREDLLHNSSLTSSAVRKHYHDCESVTAAEHAQFQCDIRKKRKVHSVCSRPLHSSSAVRKDNCESSVVENIHHHLHDTITPIEESDSNCNDNFISSTILDNIVEEAQEEHEEESIQSTANSIIEANPCFSSLTTLNKPRRLAKKSTLTRAIESFANLSIMDLSSITSSSTEASCSDSSLSSNIIGPLSTEQEVSKHSIPIVDSSVLVSDNSSHQEATNIIEGLVNIDTTLPNIPASISMSTCCPSADNLSQTSSMLDDQGSKISNAINTDRNKNSMNNAYGWFVETDARR